MMALSDDDGKKLFQDAGVWILAAATSDRVPGAVRIDCAQALSDRRITLVNNALKKTSAAIETDPSEALTV